MQGMLRVNCSTNKPLKVMISGALGSGKGTQCELIVKNVNSPIIFFSFLIFNSFDLWSSLGYSKHQNLSYLNYEGSHGIELRT